MTVVLNKVKSFCKGRWKFLMIFLLVQEPLYGRLKQGL